MASIRKIVLSSGTIAWEARIKSLSGKKKTRNHAATGAAQAWIKQHEGAGRCQDHACLT